MRLVCLIEKGNFVVGSQIVYTLCGGTSMGGMLLSLVYHCHKIHEFVTRLQNTYIIYIITVLHKTSHLKPRLAEQFQDDRGL